MNKIDLFGVKIDNLDINTVLNKIGQFLNSQKQYYIVLPYSEFIINAQKDEEFKNILNKADLCLCESRGLYLVARFLNKKIKEPINGIELIYKISNNQDINQKIFLLGGRKNIVKKARNKLKSKVIGVEHGYQNLSKVIKKINKLSPNILLVAMGSPKQEKWIFNNLNKMPSVKVAIGVGGAFDFISGHIKRAPRFLQKTGLEWLWRLIIQPKRIKRIYNGVIKLGFLTLKWKILKK